MRISHEAIYKALSVEGSGALQRELFDCLRTGRALRVPRARTRLKTWAHVTADVTLSEGPAEAADRVAPCHREGDLIIGLERSAIGTLVERTTRFTMLVHLPRGRGRREILPIQNSDSTELRADQSLPRPQGDCDPKQMSSCGSSKSSGESLMATVVQPMGPTSNHPDSSTARRVSTQSCW